MALLETLIQLIQTGNKAKHELYTNSRTAEDSVRTFQTQQKKRIDELAENTISDIRDITEKKYEVLNKIMLELSGYLKLMSQVTPSDKDVDQATAYIDSLNKDSLLEDIAIDFDGDLDIAETLMSVSCLGSCPINLNDLGTGVCGYNAEETEKKRCVMPYYQRIGYRMVEEQSWTSRSSLSSISDNNFYDTESIKGPNTTLDVMKVEIDFPYDKEKILNNSSDECLARYVGQFQTYKHRTACVIPDITILNDMRIVLIDHYHNSIQLFSEKFDKLDEKTCPYPIGLCSLNGNHVVVTLRRIGQLATFQVSKAELLPQHNFRVKCDSYLWQVTCKSSKIYVVCDENNIHVLDLDGQELNVVRSGVSPELGYLRYFDVNDKDRCIYMTERRGLRCINFKGKLHWLFTNDDFPERERDSRGHAIEDVCYFDGVVLGAHWTLSKIFQISLSGKFLRNIIVDNLEYPRIISMKGRRLVVTQFHPTMKPMAMRTVKVFEVDNLSSH